MKNEKGKYSVFITLFGIPFSLVVSLIVIYIAMFGMQFPFEIQLRTKAPNGKLLTENEIKDYRSVLIDSVRILREDIKNIKNNVSEFKVQADSLLDLLQVLQIQKSNIENEINTLQIQLNTFTEQKNTVDLAGMDKFSNILKSLTDAQLDSLYANLDDKTIMAIIDMSKSRQAISAVFQHVEPSRAARLTSKYINVKNQ